MWTRITNAIPESTVNKVLEKSGVIAEAHEDRHFVKAGKTFFKDNKNLLLELHKHVSSALKLSDFPSPLVINHAFLLYKSGPGPATLCHQDRPYWFDIETECTMFTVWIALAEIDENIGTLTLNPNNEVKLNTFLSGYKNGDLLEHVEDQYGGGGFTITLPEKVATVISKDLQPQKIKRGDIVLFDAFEPHASTANVEKRSRLAMKIVYGDPSSMDDFLIDPNMSKTKRIFSEIQKNFGVSYLNKKT